MKVTEENLKELFADAQIVCEAFDNPVAKAMLVNGITEHFPEKKLVSATGMAGYESSNIISTKKMMKNFLFMWRSCDRADLWEWINGSTSCNLCRA